MGAKTSQLMIGQRRLLSTTKNYKRIRAAVLMSPSCPSLLSARSVFGSVITPCLLLTGTRDNLPSLSNQSIDSRRTIFAALPSGNAYELVLFNATQSAFSDRLLRNDPPPNPKHHRAIQAITTAFWDAYLQGNEEAQKWRNEGRSRTIGHLANKMKPQLTSTIATKRLLSDTFSPHGFPVFRRWLCNGTADVITNRERHIKVLIWVFVVQEMMASAELI